MRKLIGIIVFAAGAAITSLPAVAAPPPLQFGFSLGAPPPPDVYLPPSDECLSVGEIIGEVRSMGYRSARVLADDGDVLTVRARLGYRRYILVLDDCSGDLVSRQRVY